MSQNLTLQKLALLARKHPDFTFRLTGITTHVGELLGWLQADLPYLENSLPPSASQLVTRLGFINCTARANSIFTETELRAVSSRKDRNQPLFWQHCLVLAQDVFCVLERRGFRVEYLGGDLAWWEKHI